MRGKVTGEEEPPRKRVKLQQASKTEGTYRFSSAQDISRSLQAGNEDGVIAGAYRVHRPSQSLLALRNQFNLKPGETVTPQDERLLLARSWLRFSPGAREIFGIWGGVNQRQAHTLALITSLLAALLNLLSSHHPDHSLGMPVHRTLLTAQWMQHLNTYIAGSHNDLLISTLKLLNAMSNFAGGSERRFVLDSFAWETKSLPKLLYMRRKAKTGINQDGLLVPDIRTLYVLFMLSFVDSSTSTSVKAAFLEQRRDVFGGIWKGLLQDSYSVVRRVLEVCWTGIWSDQKLKRSIKVGIFQEATLTQIVKLYERSAPEGNDDEQIPADVVHHFLLAICTRPGVGVCFRDRGWYPRESEDDLRFAGGGEEDAPRSGRVFNKILANLMKGFKVNEDPRQQELALKVLSACPELVTSYWSAIALTLEPRLSSKWITNVSFLGSVISLPIPEQSFIMPNSNLYLPAPPPLAPFLENTFPSTYAKVHISRGLQSSSPLVQHCTSQALAKCLTKYATVLELLEKVEHGLEEDDQSGQWRNRRRELEREVRKRVPEFAVVVALSQQHQKQEGSSGGPIMPESNRAITAMLAESSTRLLWLYHRCLPSLVAEARFDVGKLLHSFSVPSVVGEAGSLLGLRTLRQLHVLRLLKESDQFAWSTKTGSLSPVHVLLQLYTMTQAVAVRDAVEALLQSVFSRSIIFQHDPDEVQLWLVALPVGIRASGVAAPDGTPLLDERAAVTIFLDDCIQRFLKTPHRYIEDLQRAFPPMGDHAASTDQDSHPSALVMTVLEQMSAKISASLLSESDILALVTYTRKLITSFSSKIQMLHPLEELAAKLLSAVHVAGDVAEHKVVRQAIVREVGMVVAYFDCLRGAPSTARSRPAAVSLFLNQIELLERPATPLLRQSSAYELVDWLRLLDSDISNGDVAQLVKVVGRLHPPALRQLLEYLHPAQQFLSEAEDFLITHSEHPFNFLYLQSSPDQLANSEYIDILCKSVVSGNHAFQKAKQALILVHHRLCSASVASSGKKSCLELMASIVRRFEDGRAEDAVKIKEVLFGLSAIKELCTLDAKSRDTDLTEGLRSLLLAAVDPLSPDDKRLLADFTSHWANLVRTPFDIEAADDVRLTKCQIYLWIAYLRADDVLALLDRVLNHVTATRDDWNVKLLPAVLAALEQGTVLCSVADDLLDRLPRLVSLIPLTSHKQTLIGIIAQIVGFGLPIGLNGLLPSSKWTDLPSLVSAAESRWGHRSKEVIDTIDVSFLLGQDRWTKPVVSILSGLAYLSSSVRSACWTYLRSEAAVQHPMTELAPVMWASLDMNAAHESVVNEVWQQHFVNLLLGTTDNNRIPMHRQTCLLSVSAMLGHFPASRPTLLALATTTVLQAPSDFPIADLFHLAGSLAIEMPIEAQEFVSAILDRGLQWAVRKVAHTNKDQEDLEAFVAVVAASDNVKAHLADPILAAVTQGRLSDTVFLKLAVAVPLIINRHLQSIVQHPSFHKQTAPSAPTKDDLIELVSLLFHRHPVNTCQPTHIQPLAQIYCGSLSRSDRTLLRLFRLYEETKKVSIASLLTKNSSDAAVDARQSIGNLDSNRVFRTCLAFPTRRSLDPDKDLDTGDQHVYDPVFVVLLSAQMLAICRPSSALEWVQFFRSNTVSLLIRCLSSADNILRDLSLAQLATVASALQAADMHEKLHVIHILDLLRDAVSKPASENPPRLPTFTTLLLAHALRGVFYPANSIYPLTARFLLQRPELDTTDIPMLYNMLYSDSEDWRKERTWQLKFLADAMLDAGEDEWRIFKRRHTWDLLASIWQSGDYDRSLRVGVLDILQNLTAHRRIATSLVLKSGLLAWIEMALVPREDEMVRWLIILDNIVTVVDAPKLESATSGEWRASIGRAVSLLASDSGKCLTDVVRLGSQLIIKLGLLPGPPVPNLETLVAKIYNDLMRLEGTLDNPQMRSPDSKVPFPLNTGWDGNEIEVWGLAVEGLWRSVMLLEAKSALWDGLTYRLLIWHAIGHGDQSGIGHWVRKEIVACKTAS
ncbi:hypothetical protein FA95DRAFT_1483272 [Auriscalpium vulgare]|uniref:Uncharacterized protein n=1 Tax=Auriscalpium vulgare TaxID=40419 RepID=A0ACB8S9Q5_9AGAM|nr:hypothetical protein FA95DRAFT_1483272 [Auriscalpium vulgare]